jgi:protein involved in polysaccharide export with SLBB domain
VFVGGEVVRPGQFNMTSLADIATALAQAGGIRRGGSLRQVRLVRAGGGTQTVDLYGLLGIGSAPAVRLRDGDRVIVPVIGPTVAVTGAVARPGIYELRGAASIGDVIAYSGGPIRQRGAQAVISRVAADGTESFIRAAGPGERVIGGDAVQVIGGSAGGVSGRVELRGNVDNPGPRPLLAARTVAELVGAAEDLRADTYQMAAILVRRDAETGARVFAPVALARELRGLSVTRLMSDDRLYLFSREDIAFMNGVPVRQIVLGQPNPLPQCRSLVALSRLVRDTQTARFSAVTRGGFVVETATGAVVGAAGSALGGNAGRSLDRLVARDEEADPEEVQRLRMGGPRAAAVAGGVSGARTRPADGGGGDGALPGSGARATASDDDDTRPRICPDVFEELPDLLPVLLEHSISVGGAVRRPGAYPVAGSVTARDLALLAEGLVGGAADLTLDVNRADDRPVEHVRADTAGAALVATSVGPGDDIRFNARQPLFEGSGVLLSGEVARPGLYAIRRGETLAQLLARAGGLTELSYAYGTVFTRRSVRQSQEEGFRRTARELNNSLLAVAARSNNGSGSGLAGAASLIQTLAQTEASGRMVVEGDPRVLAIRPDLDTILEAGDAIHVPKRPNNVLVLGDVNNPGALQFVPGKSAGAYVNEAGGILATADRKRIFMVLPNGTARPVALDNRIQPPPPGSTIIVPKNIDPLYRLSVIRDVTTIISQLATSVATVAILATN